jgi:hypothetical protein
LFNTDTTIAGDFMGGQDKCSRRPWHKPHISRIEIKRTMVGGNSRWEGDTSSTN